MLTRRKFSAIGAAIATVFSLTACGAGGGGGADDDSISVGAVFPQSGDLAYTGERALQGVHLAADLINADGGVKGKTIKIQSVDASDPAGAQSGVKQLITRDDVKILVGSASSSIGSVGAPTAQKLGAVYWETGAIADSITGSGYTHVFRTIMSGSILGAYAAKYIVEQLSSAIGKAPSDLKVALLYTDDAYGSGMAPSEKKTLKDAGVTVTEIPYTASSMKDFTPTILKMKNEGTDIVLAAAQLADAVLFWQQCQQLGFTPKAAVATGAGYAEAGFAEGLKGLSDGIFNAIPGTPESINPKAMSPEAKKVYANYQAALKKKGYTQTPNMDWAFMGAWTLFHDVLPNAKSMNADDVAKAAYKVEIAAEDTITGFGVKFAQPGSKNAGQNTAADPVIQQWQNGELKAVYPNTLATATSINVPLPPLENR